MRNAVAFSLLSFLLFPFESSAVHVTIQRPPKAAFSANNNLINTQNQRYGTNITISGRGMKAFQSIPRHAGRDSGNIGVGAFQRDSQYTVPFQVGLLLDYQAQFTTTDVRVVPCTAEVNVVPTFNIGADEADALFGDSFLRNVYTTGATKFAPELVAVRKQTLAAAGMPPEVARIYLVKIFNGTQAPGAATPVAGSGAALDWAVVVLHSPE
ncbi:hypothetical protein DFH09DRAFT_1305254 [Mycena vulgaris]|nr:hypothetical protein DFH09DRAFT_1305254 [Mycena vulgaris]